LLLHNHRASKVESDPTCCFLIAAQRANRTIRRVVQTLATAVFLPI
jgi:hypothetical protein